MSRLSRIVGNKDPGERLKKLTENIPEYNIDKNSLRQKMSTRRKFLVGVLIVILAVIAFIYLPGFFMNDEGDETWNNITTDTNAVARSAQILRDYPNEDFDDDGLDNVTESNLGTSPWYPDTDGDGASDYYEVKVSDTDPLSYDNSTIKKLVEDEDESNGAEVQSPYKIGNVILWADNYDAKASGAVIDSLSGYHFTNFTGYAEFQDGSSYAYMVTDDKHELLPFDSKNNVWRITGSCDVETYDEMLKEVVDVGFFSANFYPDADGAASFLARILPNKGFVTAEIKTLADIEPDDQDADVITPATVNYDPDDDTRFMEDMYSLSELHGVMDEIDNKKCVAVSLFNENAGEYIGIVYGYDKRGNFYIADPDTLEYVGTIRVEENAMRFIGEGEELTLRTYFSFSGLGFSSAERDRINFFATSSANGSSNAMVGDIEQEAIDNATEDETDEDITEAEIATGNSETTEEILDGDMGSTTGDLTQSSETYNSNTAGGAAGNTDTSVQSTETSSQINGTSGQSTGTENNDVAAQGNNELSDQTSNTTGNSAYNGDSTVAQDTTGTTGITGNGSNATGG